MALDLGPPPWLATSNTSFGITPFDGLCGCALHHQVDGLVVECHTKGLWDGIISAKLSQGTLAMLCAQESRRVKHEMQMLCSVAFRYD